MAAITHQASLTNTSLEKCYINIQNMIHLFVGDFTAEESEPCLAHFLYECNAKNIVN